MRLTAKDKLKANRILSSEDVWPTVHEDGASQRDRYNAASQYFLSPDCYVLLPHPDVLFIGHPYNSTTLFVHAAILKRSRGIKGVKATRKAIEWIFKNSKYKKLVALVPEFNKPAISLARLAGFTKEGVITKGLKKNNKVHDMIMYGLTKEVLKCQQSSQ